MIDKVDFRERPWVQVDNRTENLLHLTETSLITKWYRNLSSGKAKELVIDPMVKKDESTNWAEIHAMFDPAVEAIHGIHHTQAIEKGLISPKDIRPYGDTWIIDPAYGFGEYWYHIVDSDIVVVSMSVSLRERVVMRGWSTGMVGFGCYMEDMPMFFIDSFGQRHPSLIGYALGEHYFQQIIEADAKFSSYSISLLPSAIPRLAGILQVTSEQLLQAIGLLNGYHDIPALTAAVTELGNARLCRSVATSYYRAKVTECFALLVSESKRCTHDCQAYSAVDERLYKYISLYIKSNVAKDLSTRALSSVFHVSESRMIDAFKKVVNKTPQEYVREQRIEYAQRLLAKTDLSIRQIAEAVGYSNQGSFSETFKALSCCTPSRYRAIRK